MSLNGNPYGGPRPIQPPLSRSDKVQLILSAVGLLYLAFTLCLAIRNAFLWFVGACQP